MQSVHHSKDSKKALPVMKKFIEDEVSDYTYRQLCSGNEKEVKHALRLN